MEDAKIVQMYWDRNQQALTVTAEKYGNYCMAIAKNILISQEDAEECVNDTYLGAWNAMPPHRPQILGTFLGKITRNLSLDRYRYNTAQKRNENVTVTLEELNQCISGHEDTEQLLDHRELVLAINEFLADLPAQKRNIFICRYWYFDSVGEIAARFGLRQNHVSVILNRLRGNLRDHLVKRGYTL